MVKVKNNPQGARVLPNELLGGLCLDWLGVNHPKSAVVEIPQTVLDDSGSPNFSDGQALASGQAFGSEFLQSDPAGTVPPDLIKNHSDIAGTYVFDTWVRQHDGRQYRVLKNGDEEYKYFPVDQGHSFGAPNWTGADLDSQHDQVTLPAEQAGTITWEVLEAFVQRLREFETDDAEQIVGQLPTDWLSDDERTSVKNYLTARAPRAADALAAKFQPKDT